MNKKLIEALTLLTKYQNKKEVVKLPVGCNYCELIVHIDDIREVSFEDMRKLHELKFLPGCENDFVEDLGYFSSEELWNSCKEHFSNCFHSYYFA